MNHIPVDFQPSRDVYSGSIRTAKPMAVLMALIPQQVNSRDMPYSRQLDWFGDMPSRQLVPVILEMVQSSLLFP